MENNELASHWNRSNTLQTQLHGGDGKNDCPLAFPGPADVVMNTIVPSLTAATQSPSQMLAHISKFPSPLQISENFSNTGSEGFPDVGVMPSRMPSLTPPHHTRPLYHSTELPELDDKEPLFGVQEFTLSPAGSPIPVLGPSPEEGTTRRSPPANESAVLEFPLQTNALGLYTDTPYLHDIVRRAVFDPSFSLHPLEPSVLRHLGDPAAGFDVRGLSILFLVSGTALNIYPSIRNRGFVCVGDVLRALKTAPAGSDARRGTRVGVIVKGYY